MKKINRRTRVLILTIVMAVVPIEPLEAMIESSQLAPMFDSSLILTILNGGF